MIKKALCALWPPKPKKPTHPCKSTHNQTELLMTIADQILAIQADLTTLKAAVAAIPTTTGTGAAVDLTPVETAIAGVQTSVDAIKADLTPTPAA